MPSSVDSALLARLQRLNEEFADAVRVLEARPGWLHARVRQNECVEAVARAKTADENIPGGAARLQFVLRLFDCRAEMFCSLVEDAQTQAAYLGALRHLGGIAWIELTGSENPIAVPTDAAEQDQLNAISLRSHSWATKGYRRLAEHQVGSNNSTRPRRGRPPLPEELKRAAITLRAAGGSNREAACIVYETKRPTAIQVKDVSSVLRQYKAKVSISAKAASK